MKQILRGGRSVFVWGLLLSALIGLFSLGDPIENAIQSGYIKARSQQASGDVVIVGIDDLATEEEGAWPWTYQKLSSLLEKVDAAGANRIFFAIPTMERKSASENTAFANALKNTKAQVYLNASFQNDQVTQTRTDSVPPAMFRKYAKLVNTNAKITAFATTPDMPYSVSVAGQAVPSIAAVISGKRGAGQESFPIDYAIDVNSIPYFSAADVLNDTRLDIRGKDIIIGKNGEAEQKFWILGVGMGSRPFISALSSETLIKKTPRDIGWMIPVALAWLFALVTNLIRNDIFRVASKAATVGIFLTAPIYLESTGIFLDIFPALFLLALTFGVSAWTRHSQNYKQKGKRNEISGLPNLNALRQSENIGDIALVAMRVHNHVEINASFDDEGERILVKQVASRLDFGIAGATLYQGDEGVFLWCVPTEQQATLTDQLSALHAIFRNPVPIGDLRYDLDVTFGIDVDTDRSLASRMSSVLLAAQEARETGESWRFYDPSHQQASAWRLSMLGELDSAIDNNELWVAYQPKIDIMSGLIIGAEALVRWTHPEKGEINPEEFVVAAEKHNRISKLTEFVLDQSLATAKIMNSQGRQFQIAVNLSPRMLDEPGLAARLEHAFAGHSVEGSNLMLEVTETAAISSSADALQQLQDLRDMGIGISIDDYGTGFSTLDYLKKCPATEVKIDRSFVRMLTQSHSDRIMVNSTIELAHSLGQKVVAEGVEDAKTLSLLAEMHCDIAQGYLVGRPMHIDSFLQFFKEHKSSAAA